MILVQQQIMDFSTRAFFWLSWHQIGLVCFGLLHLFYNMHIGRYNLAWIGVMIGFSVHSMLVIAYTGLVWVEMACIRIFAFGLGSFGWALSLLLIASLDHWSMPVFLIMSITWPVVILCNIDISVSLPKTLTKTKKE